MYHKNTTLLKGIEQLLHTSDLLRESHILNEINVKKLMNYLDLLEKWNKTYNLSAIREREEMEIKHVLDSLAIVPFLHEYLIKKEGLIDIGTGAGLPGIILAILYPETPIYLVECVGKKTAFLQQVALELQLKNVKVHNKRIQELELSMFAEPPRHFMSRAFCRMADFYNWTKHLHRSNHELNTINTMNNIIWAMKAKKTVVQEELIELIELTKSDTLHQSSDLNQVANIFSLNVPFLNEERCLICIKI